MQPEIALLQGLGMVLIKLQGVSSENFAVLLKGVGKTMGYQLSSRLTSKLAVTHEWIIEHLLTT